MILGRTLHRVAKALCSADIRERVIDALIADCQHEWLSAANSASRVTALARCWGSFWISLAGCLAHDVRHDRFGFARRVVAPTVSVGFWLIVGLIMIGGRSWVRDGSVDAAELSRNIKLIGAYLPAMVIAFYRNKASHARSWAGVVSSIALMAAFLALRELFSEYRFILGWAAGSCIAASWTFMIKKERSVVESSDGH